MNSVAHWIDINKKRHVKLIFILLLSYLFLGISEGNFYRFDNWADTGLNFLFTVICVSLNWILFNKLFQPSRKKELSAIRLTLLYVSILLLLIALTTILNWFYIEIIWKESLSDTDYFSIILPLAFILFSSWIVGSWWIYQLELKIKIPKKSDCIRIEAQKGQLTVLVEVENIMGFSLEDKVVFAIKSNGERLIVDKNLSTLELELIDFNFFRANRQLLIKKTAIDSYKSISNEKIEISLHEPFTKSPKQIISRYKASKFRKWISSEPTI